MPPSDLLHVADPWVAVGLDLTCAHAGLRAEQERAGDAAPLLAALRGLL